MKQMFIALLSLAVLSVSGIALAQEAEAEPAASSETASEPTPWYEQEEESRTRGFIGGLLGAGFGVNGQIDTNTDAYVETSLLFALRGGLLLGEGNRWMLGFEVAPVSNRLDWRLRATATGFVSFGSLVTLKKRENWAWLWKVGLGVGGGLDYRFLVGAQVDVLTFNYKMRPNLWIDFGIPTIRFHIETADQARWNTQFVFPFGMTLAI